MADTFTMPDPEPPSAPPTTAGRAVLRALRKDPVLLGAFVLCALLISFQLAITVLQPSWIGPVTNWLRAGLAWPQFLVVAWVVVSLQRAAPRFAAAWMFAALGLLSYAVGRTLWTIAAMNIYPQGVPFPSFPAAFFLLLQYPLFFAALFLAREDARLVVGLRTLVDGLLWMSSVTALIWYFVLDPIAGENGLTQLAKTIGMGYQVGDLVLFYGVVLVLMHRHHTTADQVGISLLCVAVACLLIADTWAAVLLVTPPHTYRTGSPPDLFWSIFYLLLPLVGLVRLRLTPAEIPPRPEGPSGLGWRDLWHGTQFILPGVAALMASAVIVVDALVTEPSRSALRLPVLVGFGLLALALLRPVVFYVEQQHLRRERDAATAREAGLRLAFTRMEQFFGVVSHELKTPLTTIQANTQLLARRLDALVRSGGSLEDDTRAVVLLRTLVERCEHSLLRLRRLIGDMLDMTRIQQGQMECHMAPCDLDTIVSEIVEDQALLNPTRQIRWMATACPVPVIADAGRIEQVVTNYLNNSLKFSREDQAVEVRLETIDGLARVSVHDEGIGVPLEEQTLLWERFYQSEATAWQSGSQIGLGMGLYISKTIVERHHGQVGMQSSPGHGSTFWFTLPLYGDERS